MPAAAGGAGSVARARPCLSTSEKSAFGGGVATEPFTSKVGGELGPIYERDRREGSNRRSRTCSRSRGFHALKHHMRRRVSGIRISVSNGARSERHLSPVRSDDHDPKRP